MLACSARRPNSYADDAATILRVLARLREVPLADALSTRLLDDLDAVLGEYTAPSAEDLPVLASRLDAELTRVLELLPQRVPRRGAERLLSLAGRIIGQPLPDHYVYALGQLRRLAVLLQHALDLMEWGGMEAGDVL